MKKKIFVRKGDLKFTQKGISGHLYKFGFFIVDKKSILNEKVDLYEGMIIKEIIDKRGNKVPIVRLVPHTHKYSVLENNMHKCECGHSEPHKAQCPHNHCPICGEKAELEHKWDWDSKIELGLVFRNGKWQEINIYKCMCCGKEQEFVMKEYRADLLKIAEIAKKYLANPELIPPLPPKVTLKYEERVTEEIITRVYIEPHTKYWADAPWGSEEYWMKGEGRWIELKEPKIVKKTETICLNREEYDRYLAELQSYFAKNEEVNTLAILILANDLYELDYALCEKVFSEIGKRDAIESFLANNPKKRKKVEDFVKFIEKIIEKKEVEKNANKQTGTV